MMENEIIINGITYVKKEISKNEEKKHKIEDLIEFKGLKWFVTKVEDDGITLMVADKMPNNIIEEVFDDKSMRDCDNDVKFDKENDDWKQSYIRRQLNNKFLKALNINKNDLLEMTTNYAEDEYTSDLVRIPSLKECRELSLNVVKRESIWSYFLINRGCYRGGVCSNGAGTGVFSFYGVYNVGAANSSVGFRVVRPVIKVKKGVI